MKHIVGICLLLVAFSAFSCAKKQVEEKKMTLEIHNETGAEIDKIIVQPADAEAFSADYHIDKGGVYTVPLEEHDYYGIILVDTKGHYYGKEKLQWAEGPVELTITGKDFISQGLWDSIKHVLGL